MEHVSIWGTPFPGILNQKNSTGSAGGAKNSQNGVFLETDISGHEIYPKGPSWPMCNFNAKHVVDLLMVEKNIMMKPQNIGMLYPILKMISLHFYFLYMIINQQVQTFPYLLVRWCYYTYWWEAPQMDLRWVEQMPLRRTSPPPAWFVKSGCNI